mmetsp:Transcript_7252/g.18304  ORF Transcript_7252/g.18304 Transcript_7252/m.18304 type:complete len:336 (+) Transcript_7252:203-1210(+)
MTDAYRLVNREGDFLSGLAVDVFGHELVVRSSSLWTELHRDDIQELLRLAFADNGEFASKIHWQRDVDALTADGFREHFGYKLESADAVSGSLDAVGGLDATAPVTIRELGVKYLIHPGSGKKTGHFVDQRENRGRLRSLVETMVASRGLTKNDQPLKVLDLFCYSGGFAMNAALCPGVVATAVDMTAEAVSIAQANAVENGIAERMTVVNDNAFTFLQEEAAAGKQYDIVVCDPPRGAYGSADRQEEFKKCEAYHRRINRRSMSVLRRGGVLVTCSCSQVLVQARSLLKLVQQAAALEGRTVRLLRRSGSGPDHTIHPSWLPDGHLEALWLVVD